MNKGGFPAGREESSQLLGIFEASGERSYFMHLTNTGFVGSQATVSLLNNLTIAKRVSPFARFQARSDRDKT
jgi:hypothetical protein